MTISRQLFPISLTKNSLHSPLAMLAVPHGINRYNRSAAVELGACV